MKTRSLEKTVKKASMDILKWAIKFVLLQSIAKGVSALLNRTDIHLKPGFGNYPSEVVKAKILSLPQKRSSRKKLGLSLKNGLSSAEVGFTMAYRLSTRPMY